MTFHHILSNPAVTQSWYFLLQAFVGLVTIQLLGRDLSDQFPENFLIRLKPNFHHVIPDNACNRQVFGRSMTFDYIIVGSGPAGSVLANRLSEDLSRTVLLVEVGDDPLGQSFVPTLFPFMLNMSTAWNYTTEVSPSSCNAFRNGCNLNVGKMLGGSTGMNAMMFLCGVDKDYDDWAASGSVGWDYASILPFIKKFEGNANSSIVDYSGGKYHSMKGPLTVSNYFINDTFLPLLQEAVTQAGFRQRVDFNSREYIGFVKAQATIRKGERCSASRAFLVPVRSRKNLFVLKRGLVTKLLFADSTNEIKVTGVSIRTDLKKCPVIEAKARRETILSAGALGSPKILQLSGIGKLEDLLPHGIRQIKELPVGDHYQDHIHAVHFLKGRPSMQAVTLLDFVQEALTYLEIESPRQGSFTGTGIFGYTGFINTADPTSHHPDIQFHFYRYDKFQRNILEVLANFGYKDEFIKQIRAANDETELLSVYTIIAKPKSSGTVKLRNTNPFSAPIVNSNFLQHADDRRTLLAGIRKLQTIVNTPIMISSGIEFVRFNITECDSLVYDSDDYIDCYTRYFTSLIWHPCCTSRMGSVVDERLRVKGIQKLRVVDASIMPTIVSTNPQCAVYAIGEKAADMIKQDNKPKAKAYA